MILLTHWRLFAFAAVAALLGMQTMRLDRAQLDLERLQASISAASSKSETRAAQTGLEAVTSYVQKQQADAPVVERVVDRVRNVCLRKPASGDLPIAGAPGVFGQAGREAQDDRARTQYLQDVADDLVTCKAELDRLDAIRDFHNANVGDAR